MAAETVFTICNNGVIPAWILLAVAPRWRWTQRIVHAIWIPGLLGLAYLWAVLTGTSAPEGASFFSLEGVMILFTNPHAVLAGWLHYLAFDLFVGAWEVRDAQRHAISPFLVAPCLFLTLMLGPLGFLLYCIVRLAIRRRVTFVEA